MKVCSVLFCSYKRDYYYESINQSIFLKTKGTKSRLYCSVKRKIEKKELKAQYTYKYTKKLEGHSVERIFVRQRSSDGSVNKTI